MRVWFSKRSNRRLLFGFLHFFILCCILAGALWGTLHLPFVSVRSVSMSPKSDVEESLHEDILAYAEKHMNERIYGLKGKVRFFFKKDEFEMLLRERFLQADAIAVESDFWGAWHIVAKRRSTFGTHCTPAGDCLLIDTTGFAFMESDMRIGSELRISDMPWLGEYIFGSDQAATEDFGKVSEIVLFLEKNALFVKYVSLRKDTRVVHMQLENGIGIWLDASEALYDTTRALHVVFEEIFVGEDVRKDIVSVDVRNPLSILYERE